MTIVQVYPCTVATAEVSCGVLQLGWRIDDALFPDDEIVYEFLHVFTDIAVWRVLHDRKVLYCICAGNGVEYTTDPTVLVGMSVVRRFLLEGSHIRPDMDGLYRPNTPPDKAATHDSIYFRHHPEMYLKCKLSDEEARHLA